MKRKILFLENDNITRVLYRSKVDPSKYDYEFANSLDAALRILKNNQFDIIVADCQFADGKLVLETKILTETPSILILDGSPYETIHSINNSYVDLIFRDKTDNFVYDLLDLIEISTSPQSPFFEAVEALPIFSN